MDPFPKKKWFYLKTYRPISKEEIDDLNGYLDIIQVLEVTPGFIYTPM